MIQGKNRNLMTQQRILVALLTKMIALLLVLAAVCVAEKPSEETIDVFRKRYESLREFRASAKDPAVIEQVDSKLQRVSEKLNELLQQAGLPREDLNPFEKGFKPTEDMVKLHDEIVALRLQWTQEPLKQVRAGIERKARPMRRELADRVNEQKPALEAVIKNLTKQKAALDAQLQAATKLNETYDLWLSGK